MTGKIIEKIENSTAIAIIYDVSSERLLPLAKAIFGGGIKLFMCNYSQSLTSKETENNIKALKQHFGDDVIVGAGNITEKSQLEKVKETGGQFVFCKNADIDIIKYAKNLNLVSIACVSSHSQIKSVTDADADFVQTYPISLFDNFESSIRLLKLKNFNEEHFDIEKLYKTNKKIKLDVIKINL